MRPFHVLLPCLRHLVFHSDGCYFNTLRPRQNGFHFADDIFKCIFLNENVWIPIKISLKFVPKDPINNIPALVRIMAWRRPGDKPLTESMMVCLPTHTFVTRPHWVKLSVIQGRWALDPLPVITKKMAFKCDKSNPITIKYVSSASWNLVVSYVFHLYWNDTSVWYGE